jgi:DNA polymerase III alpha subunit
MIPLKLRTEYSFRFAYGTPGRILEALAPRQLKALPITDSNTWGHVNWGKACKAAGIQPIFGAEVLVVDQPTERLKQATGTAVLLARTDAGLVELYQLMTWASTTGFYYAARVGMKQLAALSDQVIVLLGPGTNPNLMAPGPWRALQLSPEDRQWNKIALSMSRWQSVLVPDNYYPLPEHRPAYEILVGDKARSRAIGLMHIADEYELMAALPEARAHHMALADHLALSCHAKLPKAQPVVPERPDTLWNLCLAGAKTRGLTLNTEYIDRLKRELAMIESKGFEDYFYVITEMITYAKQHMLVGPARGSSAGSLVCYLLGITDVDPILHDLMFERFIDVTRADLPDIDIDFQDDRRELVIEHLRQVYGAARVGRIGTVMRNKAKSTLTDVGRELQIPAWDLQPLKDAVIERSSGDARAQFCIADALETLDVGKAIVEKYPGIVIASELEGHARNSGQHAAGVIVCQAPVTNYCTTDKSGASQIDKKDAEVLNLLKIDILGLRTLTVIQDTLDQIGKTRDWLIDYPLDDQEAYEIFNSDRFSGIFQYEGFALQSLTKQMKIKSFEDIAVITALARPGPLHCGAATEFIQRRVGKAEATPLHPLVAHLTKETYGTVIYQEQVMAIGRVMGQLTWEDVSELRKAMSRSLGEEFFNRYWEKFRDGARAQGIIEGEARRVWDKICTFGSWAFNKSHAVSYGLLSYWCAMLKAHYPLQYAAACLRNAKDEDQSVKILRDLVKEGFTFLPVDSKRSLANWSVQDGQLIGGLTNIKGIGEKKAEDILLRRITGKPLPPSVAKLLIAPTTPYDDLFEGERRFSTYYTDPKSHNIHSGKVWKIEDIEDAGDYVFLGKLKDKNLRDLNEYGNVVKRGGRIVKANNLFLNMTVEDDTASIIIKIGRYDYKRIGKDIVENGKIGDWYLWKGRINSDGWRMVHISLVRKL